MDSPSFVPQPTRQELNCRAKIRHRSKSVARVVGQRELRTKGGPMLYVYQCEVCSEWHLTRQKQPSPSAAVTYERKRK